MTAAVPVVLPLPEALPLATQLPSGRLVELTRRGGASAQATTAVACLRAAQARGETAAWVQPERGSLYPPDLREAGVDLDALIVVHVPTRAGVHSLGKAAELLLRSGGFGMVIVDESETRTRHRGLDNATASRLFALAREHRSSVLLLTAMRDRAIASNASPLIALRIEPRRTRIRPGRFVVEPRIRKDKSGLLVPLTSDVHRAPYGLR